ncbi:MAG: DUF4982 domain-containing protein [Oscillospiraceae bacterium]|nr:DUF4982 domain-containing protein [Oscillospiraceae bacterium]
MRYISFNEGWRFGFSPVENDTVRGFGRADRAVTLPHDFRLELERSVAAPGGVSEAFYPGGVGFYEKTFIADEAMVSGKALLLLDGAQRFTAVRLNYEQIALSTSGYMPFFADMTGKLKPGENRILITCDATLIPGARWYPGGGLYRGVSLLLGGQSVIEPWSLTITTPTLGGAVVSLQAPEGMEVIYSIADADGAEVARAVSQPHTKTTIPLPNATPWSHEHPCLYTLTAQLVQDGVVQDEERARFGIRTIALDREGGLLLNGQPTKLKGGCVHHDNGILGAKSHPDAERRKVRLLKEAGFNAIRCAHNPPSQVFLDACDELGMLVIDEAFDVWNEGKKQLDEHITFAMNWEKDLRAMIGRDHNHPCIVFWSTGNEIVERFGTSDAYAWAERLAEKVRELDPTRFITNAVCEPADEMKELGDENADFFARRTAPFLAPLDAAGYNYLLDRYEGDHAQFPERLFIGTESFPIEALDNWEAVQKHPYILGDFVWTAWDYLGESGIGRDIGAHGGGEWGLGTFPIHQANCGDLDICGFKRPQSHFRDFVWSGREVPYIAVRHPNDTGKPAAISRWGWPDLWESWNWLGHEGQPIEVTVYAAGEKATLLLNGKIIDTKPIARHAARFTLPYQPGVMTVKTEHGEASLATTGKAISLRLTPETDPGIVPIGGLVYVKIEAIDAQGRLVPDANLPFQAVPGEGYSLYALGCGDIAGEQNYTSNQGHTFRGRAMAVVIKTAATSDCPLSV